MQASGLYDIKFHTRDVTSKDEKQPDAVNKSTSKQQVYFQTVVAFVVPKTGAIHLVLLGLMAA